MLIIAHRGASAEAPENTAAAIRVAFRMRADMVELDVQPTADDRVVVFHDDRVERTTNGRGVVQQLRYPVLARLDAGGWFAPRFAGERILLVSQALRLSAPHRVNLELKATPRPAPLIAGVVHALRQTRTTLRVLASSFEASLLASMRDAAPTVARALLCARPDGASGLARAVRMGCVALHPKASLVTPRLIAHTHAAGLRVHAWTVDDPALARRLACWGVDGVFTNHPDRIRRALHR